MCKSWVVLISVIVFLFLCPNPISAEPAEQELILGVPVAGSLSGTGDERYYQVSVTAGEHLFIVLDSGGNYFASELYIKFGSLPSTADYDDKGDLPNADQAVEIADTQAGTYYVMVRSTSGGWNYAIRAHTLFAIPISIGVTLQRQMTGAGREDFVVTASGDENLAIEVQPSTPTTAPLVLLERFG